MKSLETNLMCDGRRKNKDTCLKRDCGGRMRDEMDSDGLESSRPSST